MSCIQKDKFELGQSRATKGPGVLGFYSGRDHVNRERAAAPDSSASWRDSGRPVVASVSLTLFFIAGRVHRKQEDSTACGFLKGD